MVLFLAGVADPLHKTDSDGGYHGYWAVDLQSINSHYGTADDLKALVSAAHAKVCLKTP